MLTTVHRDVTRCCVRGQCELSDIFRLVVESKFPFFADSRSFLPFPKTYDFIKTKHLFMIDEAKP